MNLDKIIDLLNKHKQRATYGAVGNFLGEPPHGLMARRDKNFENSWIVAANDRAPRGEHPGAQRGRPTGYADHQIHPDCLRLINQHIDNIIDNEHDLRVWLRQNCR